VLVAYNVSSQARSDCVIVDAILHGAGSMKFLYGGTGTVPVQPLPDGTRFVRLDLQGHQFVILE
jgi:hypothetical protein